MPEIDYVDMSRRQQAEKRCCQSFWAGAVLLLLPTAGFVGILLMDTFANSGPGLKGPSGLMRLGFWLILFLSIFPGCLFSFPSIVNAMLGLRDIKHDTGAQTARFYGRCAIVFNVIHAGIPLVVLVQLATNNLI